MINFLTMYGKVLDERCAEMKVRMRFKQAFQRVNNFQYQSNLEHGAEGELAVREWLLAEGFDVFDSRPFPPTSKYDFLIDHKIRLEVKSSKAYEKNWRFTLHRHGVLDESQVDVYVFHCETAADPVFVVLPAPLGRKTFMISKRQLSRKYAPYINDLSLFR